MDAPIRTGAALCAAVLGAWVTAGCQPTTPPAPTPPPAPPVVPAAAPDAATSAADSRAAAAERLAAAQAKTIEELLAARERGDATAAPPVRPPATPVQPPKPPPAADAPIAVAEKPAAPPDQFKAVPPISEYRPPAVIAVPPPTLVTPIATAAPTPPSIAPPAIASAPPPPAGGDATGAKLDRTAAEQKSDLASQVNAQLYRFAIDQPVAAPETLAGLSREDQNVLGALLDALSMFRTGLRNDPNQLIGDKIRPLTDLGERLRSQADLRIVNPTLCRKVAGFGNYEPITPVQLVSGVDRTPVLYYEIENSGAVVDEHKMFVTSLVEDMVLYTADGKPVWTPRPKPFMDTCRNRRHDFFYAHALAGWPANLAAGNYTLKLTLTDPKAARVSEKSIAITVVAPKKADVSR